MPAPITGQAVGTGLSTAVPISAGVVGCQAFTIKASATNVASVYLGPITVTSATGLELAAGETFTYTRSTQNAHPVLQLVPSDLYLAATTGDKVTWLASP